MIAGQSPGSSNTACASTSSSSSVRPINSSACLSSRPHGRRLTRLPCLFRRHRSRHARRPGAPRLSIVGEGKPFPRVCSSKRTAQKNETHPPLLFSWTKLSCYAILDKRVFIRSRKQLYEFLLALSRGLPERPETRATGRCLERRFGAQYGSAETRTVSSATSARGPA